MSLPSDSSPHKKHKSEDDVQSPVDHRKRRRNRTTQSCLNCHGSKRMCDRKRPACGRCVKLGLSGICVYEVDDASQRSTDKDENSHLKNRIAELEGFIREYKRKPHPRWATVEPKKGSELSSSSPPVSDAGSEAESPFETKESLSFDSNDSVTSASSPCELVPHTPPAHSKEPVFLTGQDNVSSFLFSGDDSLSSLQSGTSFNLRSGQVSASHREGIDDMVGFDNVILPGDENEVFERVFSQILQQDACRSAKAENACQCMNKSSAYSVVLSLAPHVRRALDALGALPEHRALQMGESCRYLKHVKDLESVISVNLSFHFIHVLSAKPRFTKQKFGDVHDINRGFAIATGIGSTPGYHRTASLSSPSATCV
ncbi:hypothetical protein EW145_g3367 [Phellinidium pouzarii]|uniref:Zn(2)-C6 fungal-type domain-containing protein n=1 Tax=Phellinidium pouzarii TaxID=167371 RepID=A0A4S4L7X1_9AGAM|nr:hypothetical protein EW145_g3367 [Phellinidium pouzarii]